MLIFTDCLVSEANCIRYLTSHSADSRAAAQPLSRVLRDLHIQRTAEAGEGKNKVTVGGTIPELHRPW